MGTSDGTCEWDLTVPGKDTPLAREFRHHGVQLDGTDEALSSFFGSFDGSADLAERSGEILKAEFPNGR
jgi:hypothetical protein